jgi:predicted nucleic acid-binding protein
MTPKLLFDSSFYVQEMRAGRGFGAIARGHEPARLYLSAVVGSELLRGTADARAQRVIRKVWKSFEKARRLVVPVANDWYEAGVVLGKIAAKYGYERLGLSRLVHDTLIALSARRLGICVVTLNVADFQRIAEFRPFGVASPSGDTA